MQPSEKARSSRKKVDPRTPERDALLEEYRQALSHLHAARAAFQQVTDPDLISACIFEVNAAQTRCSFLLNRMKEEQVTNMFTLR